jgi:hypothetical protein
VLTAGGNPLVAPSAARPPPGAGGVPPHLHSIVLRPRCSFLRLTTTRLLLTRPPALGLERRGRASRRRGTRRSRRRRGSERLHSERHGEETQ